jgi:hypothetical protein
MQNSIDYLGRSAGYVLNTRFFLHDVDEEEKLLHLCYHSGKMVIPFGLICTPPRTALHIMKNMQACGDCFTTTKFISKIVGRSITLRDANQFHHFEDGLCSCQEYWSCQAIFLRMDHVLMLVVY